VDNRTIVFNFLVLARRALQEDSAIDGIRSADANGLVKEGRVFISLASKKSDVTPNA